MINDLCIVLARGGSKRIPRKNIRSFCGQPMLTWPIRAARESTLFDDILISTEDAEIALLAQDAGAIYPFSRSRERATDFATTGEVLREVLENWRNYAGALPEFCCCLYGTSVFVTPSCLQEARKLLDSTELVLAVSEYVHPIQRALYFNDEGVLEYLAPEYVNWRTQDCPKRYHDIGLFYYFSTKSFLNQKQPSFVTMRKKPLIIERQNAIDIDNEDDFYIAEALFKRRNFQ